MKKFKKVFIIMDGKTNRRKWFEFKVKVNFVYGRMNFFIISVLFHFFEATSHTDIFIRQSFFLN